MGNLFFDEKVILTLYQKFYGEEYTVPMPATQVGQVELMTDKHVKAQKMCYLLNLSGICVGEFNYTWNTYGPYSPGLQAELRKLDQKYEAVREFYDLKLSDAVIFSNDDDSLFWPEDKERIETLISSLSIPNGDIEARDWMELLGSMAYIARNVFPRGKYEWISEELINRKQQYNDEKKNKKAWDILLNAHLLPVGTI